MFVSFLIIILFVEIFTAAKQRVKPHLAKEEIKKEVVAILKRRFTNWRAKPPKNFAAHSPMVAGSKKRKYVSFRLLFSSIISKKILSLNRAGEDTEDDQSNSNSSD